MVFLPPFDEKMIQGFIDEKTQSQIAGFDLTAQEIFQLTDGGVLDFDNQKRKIPEHEILPLENDTWKLKPGGYLVRYNEIVEVPLNAIGLVLPRSSLMRCGGTICSAVWDPGYKGRGIGLLIIHSKLKMYKNARIAQLIFIKTEKISSKSYSGKYQNERINNE